MSREYDWSIDAYRCWEVAIAAKREMAIREGRIEPANERERRLADAGPVPPSQLEAGRG